MYYDDYDLREQSCGCPGGNPPCSYCVDTYNCDGCGHREYANEAIEVQLGYICESCQEFYAPKGFWYWFMVLFFWIWLPVIPALWIFMWHTVIEFRDYKNKNYQVPNFIRFFYEYNFTQTFYRKKQTS